MRGNMRHACKGQTMATRGGDGKSVGPSKEPTTSSWLKDVGITEPVHQHDIYMASWMASLYR